MRASISIRKNENIGLPRHVIDISYIIFHHNTAAIYAVYLGTRVMTKAPFHPNFITACVSNMLRSNLSVFPHFIIRNHSRCISRCRCHTLHLGVIWDEIGASRTDLFCTTRSLPHGPANQYHKTVESQGFLWLPWKNPRSDSATTVPLAKNDWN